MLLPDTQFLLIEVNMFDFDFDFDKEQAARENLARQQIRLHRKMRENGGDEKTKAEWMKLMQREERLRKRSEDAGFDW